MLIDQHFIRLGQFAKCGAGTVQQGLPPELTAPAQQAVALHATALVIMKSIHNTMRIEPVSGTLHGVAVLDAVQNDCQPDALIC